MFDSLSAPRQNDLDKHLDAGLRDSLNYQILRRTLIPKDQQASPGETTQAIEQAQQPPGSATGAPRMDSTAQVVDFQQVLQQRELELNVTATPEPQKTDPLALDLAGNGFSTRGLINPVHFDLDADGQIDSISAPAGDDALLAIDHNGNGRIDNGRELFGDQNGAANGFAELTKYDDNGDGRIDAQDAVFTRLRLLQFDSLGRQHSQSLAQAGVAAIDLHARDAQQALGTYDEIAQLGSFEFSDGRSGQAADLLLARR